MSRVLHYFPIIHSEADLGTLASPIEHRKATNMGRRGVFRDRRRIDHFWQEVRAAADRIPIVQGAMRVYQDSLPVGDQTNRIVEDLAKAGSQNHQILLALLARGAVLMGTEAPELLVEEYRLAQASLAGNPTADAASETLIERRDRFIAARIGTTLAAGETGILFIGALHAVHRYLNPDIQVVYPLYSPRRANSLRKEDVTLRP